MSVCNNTKLHIAAVAMGLTLLLGVLAGSVGVATARYQKDAMMSVVYGTNTDAAGTLRAGGCVYDLGGFSINDAEDPQATVVLQQNTALIGVLRFSLDDVTTEKRDVAVLSDVTAFSGVRGEYAVNEADGRLELPFSLIVSTQSRSGLVYLDVEWTPADSRQEKMTARYLLMLHPQSSCVEGTTPPTFGDDTGFLTTELLRVSVSVPSDGSGVMLAHGSSITGTFAAGTQYYTATYPQGVTLLRDSALYFPFAGGSQQELLIRCKGTTPSTPFKLSVGSSDMRFSTTAQTPVADAKTLTVSDANGVILNKKTPLVLSIKEATALADSRWNDGSSDGVQLSWELQRLMDGSFCRVTPNEDITLASTHTGSGGTLTVSAPTGKQPAGTYRLVITQTYNGCIIYTKNVRFFIDYR